MPSLHQGPSICLCLERSQLATLRPYHNLPSPWPSQSSTKGAATVQPQHATSSNIQRHPTLLIQTLSLCLTRWEPGPFTLTISHGTWKKLPCTNPAPGNHKLIPFHLRRSSFLPEVHWTLSATSYLAQSKPQKPQPFMSLPSTWYLLVFPTWWLAGHAELLAQDPATLLQTVHDPSWSHFIFSSAVCA